MSKRELNYTSTSVFKKDLPLIAELKTYAKRELKTSVSAQLICSFALELATEQREKFKAFLDRNIVDPRVEIAKKLISDLQAEGKWPEEK